MSALTLDEFLAPISEALGHATVPDAPVGSTNTALGFERDADAALTRDELAQRFAEEARAIGIEVSVASPDALAEAIVAQVRAFGGSSAVFADDPAADSCGLPDALASAGVAATRWNAADAAASVEACERADVGITFPAAGIAGSATVAQQCDERCGRAVSLLPPAHIAVLRIDTIVPRMIDLLERYDAAAVPGAGARRAGLPSSLVFITGPSATADIELVRVVGVHGPLRTAVVLV